MTALTDAGQLLDALGAYLTYAGCADALQAHKIVCACLEELLGTQNTIEVGGEIITGPTVYRINVSVERVGLEEVS